MLYATIDEIPVISLLATQCNCQTVIKDTSDLQNNSELIGLT